MLISRISRPSCRTNHFTFKAEFNDKAERILNDVIGSKDYKSGNSVRGGAIWTGGCSIFATGPERRQIRRREGPPFTRQWDWGATNETELETVAAEKSARVRTL